MTGPNSKWIGPGPGASNSSQEPAQMVSLRPPSFFCRNSLDKLHKYLLCDINTTNLLLAAGSLCSSVEKQKRHIRQRRDERWKGHILQLYIRTLTPYTTVTVFCALHIQQFSFPLLIYRDSSLSLFKDVDNFHIVSMPPSYLIHPLPWKVLCPLVPSLQ